MVPLTRGRAAAEAPTLLDALARAPAAAALVVGALGRADRQALRLAHPQLPDAVYGEKTWLPLDFLPHAFKYVGRALTARQWPRIEKVTLGRPWR
jgi:hypothetical protein